ncbi:MAG TPA: UDP-glucose/GDP-mannose dehydrogenase family protein [Jiangellaceae bacterium]
MRLTVLGMGYLGVTHATALASLGYEVLGVDVDAAKVEELAAGRVPFFEPGLQELLVEQVRAQRLSFTTSYAQAGQFGEVHFVCVGTPQQAGSNAADLRYVEAAFTEIARNVDRPCVLVGKSTVPVGTAARMTALVADASALGAEVRVAWNPEFLREGHAVDDTLHPDRLVIGTSAERDAVVLREIYAPVTNRGVPLVEVDLATAELAKASANAFLATKISFINAMAEVCEAAGADVTMLAKVLSYDERIGGRFLHAGLGFGGGCLPKDIRAFMARAGELGADQALTFLKEVDAINMRRRLRMVELARQLVGGSFLGCTVGVLGCAFKPESDDVRDSPALNVAAQIQLQGAQVLVYDPKAMDNARRRFPTLEYRQSVNDAAKGAHLLLHLTEWREFRDLDPADLNEVVADARIVDGRNALDPQRWRAAGWTYRALGRP